MPTLQDLGLQCSVVVGLMVIFQSSLSQSSESVGIPEDPEFRVRGLPNSKNEEGHSFSYRIGSNLDQSQQFRHEERTPEGTVKGSYGFKTPFGTFREVHYVADSKGFRAHVTSNEMGVNNQSPAHVMVRKVDPPPPSSQQPTAKIYLPQAGPYIYTPPTQTAPKYSSHSQPLRYNKVEENLGCQLSKNAKSVPWPYAMYFKFLSEHNYRPSIDIFKQYLLRESGYLGINSLGHQTDGTVDDTHNGGSDGDLLVSDDLQSNCPSCLKVNGENEPQTATEQQIGIVKSQVEVKKDEDKEVYLIQNIFAKRLSSMVSPGDVYPPLILPQDKSKQALPLDILDESKGYSGGNQLHSTGPVDGGLATGEFESLKDIPVHQPESVKVLTRNFVDGRLASSMSKTMPLQSVRPLSVVVRDKAQVPTANQGSYEWNPDLGFPAHGDRHRQIMIPQINRPLYDSRGVQIKPEDVPVHLHRFVPPSRMSSLPKSWRFSIPRPVPPRTVVLPPKPPNSY